MNIKYLDEIDIKQKNIVARFDLNVPIKDGVIQDHTRLDAVLPTIKYCLENGARKLVMMTHLGRPKGKVMPELSTSPIGEYLASKLNVNVTMSDSCIGHGIKGLVHLHGNQLILLENLRFHPEEEKNDDEFASKLASYGDIYLNDAFGACHREHASVHAIQKFITVRVAGPLIKRELRALNEILNRAKRPYVALLGGAKIKDKIKTIEKILPLVDRLLIGGKMAYPFLKAKGKNTGLSTPPDDEVQMAKQILAMDPGQKISLPIDHIISRSPEDKPVLSDTAHIPEGYYAFDIGPKTIAQFSEHFISAKIIFWNGPVGFFENSTFAEGTFSIAQKMAASSAYTIVGGGDSASAVTRAGLQGQFSHISTGGGASLEYIEKGSLPAIKALQVGVQ